MQILLRLKHWQVFIGIFSIYLINTLTYILDFDSNLFKVISGIIYVIAFFTWVLLIGISLNKIEDNPYHFSNIILVLAIIFCIVGYSSLYLGQLNETPKLNPIISTLTLFPFTFFGLFFAFTRVPKSLKSIESGLKAPFRFYILDAELMFMLPIGIWFLQPRLNRINVVNEELIKEKENTTANKPHSA